MKGTLGKIAIAGTEYSLDSALGEGNNAFEGLFSIGSLG